jgi:hypothetical protein
VGEGVQPERGERGDRAEDGEAEEKSKIVLHAVREPSYLASFPYPLLVASADGTDFASLLFRKPKHDMGSVENIVSNYLRQKSALTGQRRPGQKR